MSTPGYIKLEVPEHLYLRALVAVGSLSDEPTGDPDNLADQHAMLKAALSLVEQQRDEARAELVALQRQYDATVFPNATELPGGLGYYDALIAQRAEQDQTIRQAEAERDWEAGLPPQEPLLLDRESFAKEQATEPAQRPAVDVAPPAAEVDQPDDDRPAPAAVAAEAPVVVDEPAPHRGAPDVDLFALQAAMNERGLSRSAVAIALKVAPTMIGRMMQGSTKLSHPDLPQRAWDWVHQQPAKKPAKAQRPLSDTSITVAEREQWADRFVATCFEKHDGAMVWSSALPGHYEEWQKLVDSAPDLHHRLLGGAMVRAGYARKLRYFPESEGGDRVTRQVYLDVQPRPMTKVQTDEIARMVAANRPKRVENKDADKAPTPYVVAKKAAPKPSPILAVRNHEARPDKDWAGTKVVASNGVVTTVDAGYVEVDAPENAVPIPPEKADARTFDLWTDLKGGCDRPFVYLPEVLDLAGLDQDQVESAVRHPERVTIRPESTTKGYPVLGFHRGDMQAILGFRDQMKPAVIAAYWQPIGLADGYHVDRHGGGGAKKSSGLPTTVRASVKALRQRGFEIPEEWERATQPVEVCYQGQTLGKMKVHLANKQQVQGDYQRLLRQAHAIDRRKVGASA